jgi:hypothetical protein
MTLDFSGTLFVEAHAFRRGNYHVVTDAALAAVLNHVGAQQVIHSA